MKMTEDKLRSAIQISLASLGIYNKVTESALMHNIKALSMPDIMPRILCFKNKEGKSIDNDYVEMIYKDGDFKFYETDCHQEIQEVFPVY